MDEDSQILSAINETITLRQWSLRVTYRPFNILVIEDDDVDSEAILRCLHNHGGWRVVTVKSAAEALSMLWDQAKHDFFEKPYIILLDLGLPGMHGVEFLRALRCAPLVKPGMIFVLTGSADDEDRSKAMEYDVAEYLLKDELGSSCSDFVRLLEAYSSL